VFEAASSIAMILLLSKHILVVLGVSFPRTTDSQLQRSTFTQAGHNPKERESFSSVLPRPVVLLPKSGTKATDVTRYGRESALCNALSRPHAAEKARSLSVTQTALDDIHVSCNSKPSREWKQQQLFVAGPGPPLPKNALLLSIILIFLLCFKTACFG